MLNLRLGKRSTVPFCALKRDARPEQLQLARGLQKNGGFEIFSRDADAVFLVILLRSLFYRYRSRGLFLVALCEPDL